MGFRDRVWIPSRRVCILRTLVENGGEANESLISKLVLESGFSQDTRADIRHDIEHLREVGCVDDRWPNGSLHVVTITERGEDAAFGRVEVAGVERSRWKVTGADIMAAAAAGAKSALGG